MNFLRSRAEQLADHLRDSILQGQIVEPLPTTRVWSRKLGVSRPTLDKALLKLQREGLLSIKPRGVRLNSVEARRRKQPSNPFKMVRMLYHGSDFPESHIFQPWLTPLSEGLHLHQIQLVVEKCNDERLRVILRGKHRPGELFFLLGLSPTYQRLFERSRRPSIILGEPAPRVSLPFITDDQDGAVRHATQTLLRHGFSHINLLLPKVTSYGIQRTTATFQSTCAEWPHQPVQHRTTLMPLDSTSFLPAARRFVAQISGRRGIVVVAPVSVSMIMTALLQRRIAVPGQAEIIAVLHTAALAQVDPSPILYAPSVRRAVKEMISGAVHYFETGVVPVIRKTLSTIQNKS